MIAMKPSGKMFTEEDIRSSYEELMDSISNCDLDSQIKYILELAQKLVDYAKYNNLIKFNERLKVDIGFVEVWDRQLKQTYKKWQEDKGYTIEFYRLVLYCLSTAFLIQSKDPDNGWITVFSKNISREINKTLKRYLNNELEQEITEVQLTIF
ncbi:hypothetical protein [Orenia marismortui]|uniref:Uncharacterized protein n=1 Tax=Orenia marismortui TaxID=46469 RepID=A0A4R8H530_9FIRM|nr:hypothetical protein [Orenia marismortui]TDX52155.1 hypothetical protein C7959_10877 [Orenia marismortui]